MDTFIQGFFGGVLYPALVLAAMVSLVASVVYPIAIARRGEQRTRLAIAAVLPVICLTFFTESPISESEAWGAVFAGVSPLWFFFGGLLLGLALTAVFRRPEAGTQGIGKPYYVAALSAITCLFLFLLMGEAEQNTASALLGAALGAGLWFAFRGLPFRIDAERQEPP